jgi:hypothetical protein
VTVPRWTNQYICKASWKVRGVGAVGGLGVVQIVQAFNAVGDPVFQVEHAGGVDGAVEYGVARCALLHELGEEAGFVGGFPLRRGMAENPFAHGAALPIGNNLFLVGEDVLLRNVVVGHGTVFEGMQIFRRMAGQFREGRYAFWGGAAFADDQFAVADIEGFPLADFLEGQGAKNRQGMLAEVFPVEFGFNQGAFNR